VDGDRLADRLDERQEVELLEIVLKGPDPVKDGFCALTRDDLVAIAKKRFGKSMHATSMGRLLRRLGLTRQKPRPNHPLKDPAAEAAFKKMLWASGDEIASIG